MIGEAFLLGLSTGTYCAIYCGPVVLPFLFSEETKNGRQNAFYILVFMIGRLAGYIVVGAILGTAGSLTSSVANPGLEKKMISGAYTLIGLLMLITGILYNFSGLKICQFLKNRYKPGYGAFLYGFLTGINFCPPFFAAASRAFVTANPFSGAFYFLEFYIGTSVFLIPLFGIPFLKKYIDRIRVIARMLLLLLGIYFFLFLGLFGLLS